MKRIIQYGAVFCAVLIFWGIAATGETFKIMTEEYPPFNFMEEGKLTGLSTEVVQQLAKKIGHPEKIEMLPWARAYGLILQEMVPSLLPKKNMATADFSVEKMSGIVGGLGVIIGCNEGTSMISIVKDVP